MLTEDYITEVYCFIDDMMKECWKNIRKRGPGPKLSDAEVITMEIAGESLGMDCDKTIHRYFRDHWRHLFPNLGTRTTFLRQAANLWRVKQEIRRILLTRLLPNGSRISIADGFPMPVCGFRRAHFSKLFKGEATYGYCAAKAMTYYGLKAHWGAVRQNLFGGMYPLSAAHRGYVLDQRIFPSGGGPVFCGTGSLFALPVSGQRQGSGSGWFCSV